MKGLVAQQHNVGCKVKLGLAGWLFGRPCRRCEQIGLISILAVLQGYSRSVAVAESQPVFLEQQSVPYNCSVDSALHICYKACLDSQITLSISARLVQSRDVLVLQIYIWPMTIVEEFRRSELQQIKQKHAAVHMCLKTCLLIACEIT